MSFSCWLLCIYSLWLKVSPTEGKSWNAEVPQSVNGLQGSCIVIPCLFSYPGAERKSSTFTGMWSTASNENVYHSTSSKISKTFEHRTSLLGELSHRNCSLKIDHLRHTDSGQLMFRIEIEHFDKYTFHESKVSITINDSPGQPTLSIPQELSSRKRVTASCIVYHSCPSNPPNFTWSHKGTISSQSLQQTNGQWKMTSSLSFTPSKTDHNKTLSCTAVFHGGKKATKMTTLEVKYPPEDVSVISTDSVAEGSEVNMTCSSDSNPASHSYYWYSEAGTLLSEGHTFTLKNVSRHIGTIYCTANNTEGNTNSSPTQLNVLYPPEIKTGLSCTLGTSGMTCQFAIDSHPASEIKLWGADPSSELQTHEEKHGTLTIVTLQEALGFSDTVHCQATNSQGNYTMTFQVPYNHDKSMLLYISYAAIIFAMIMIVGFSVWIIKRWRTEVPLTLQPKTEMNASSQSEPKRKCSDVNPSYDDSQHVYGNMTLEEPYEEEYPYEYASEYEETYANV
ncbi:myelin-associated glycoprotein-like isoform X2 [Tachysurus fulvidraco]|uniref:myelin-associated glycoprotein-like isoform X2 n=1 Tax=Tachysurus fulvidraco TaxID=1234273 RepID=UPI000F4EF1F3|nr:myelin-associated glycoprotein-like isoform X2 [Tachysurus fulvidraco]